ncbi:hypothetical protein PAXINDRAFT_166831 [Paxillus involutus ATCC 200175]|nr:hypothetical protein PAXINDRAFT_166831 [Paxillus involutus ATCC 200175]
MHQALASLSIGDSDKPTNSPYVPPPIQRLSRSLPPSAPPPLPNSSASDPSLSNTPLPGPNRPSSTAETAYSQSSAPGPSSSKCSNILPYLHRLEIVDDMASRGPPLLHLNLSSQSFLDALAMDVASEKPLYSVETVGSSTTIWRSDPWDGSAKIADIRWPKELPLKGKARDNTNSTMVQMNGSRWKETTSFLKHGSLKCSRKFSIPHHPHFLKWKRSGNTYQCTTPTCRGAVATLESFDEDTAPKLKVFENLGSFHESVPQLDHAGISLSLLDHLFVTALLLVTEPDDWMIVARNPTSFENHSSDALSRPKSASVRAPASARQWRKIMYGEPLYPSLKTPAFDRNAVSRGGDDSDVLDISQPSQLSTSIRQWRKIVYGEPLYPSLRPQSANGLDIPPRPSTAWDTASISSESAYLPATPSSAPSTGFYDSSFFDDSDKTVPRNNTENRQYSSPLPFSPTSISPIPSSECMPTSSPPTAPLTNGRRELPAPPSSYHPPPSSQPWLHRSRSSPRLSLVTEDGVRTPMASFDDQDSPNGESVRSRGLSSGSIRPRQLPSIPPSRESTIRSVLVPPRPVDENQLSQTHQRTLPPTPGPVPRSSSATGHRHVRQSHSQAIPSRPPISSTPVRPSTASQGDAPAQARRQRHEKDPDELINWVRSTTRAHRRRARDGDDEDHASGPDDVIYEAPPPAYNAIDFSTPPQARSPSGAHT